MLDDYLKLLMAKSTLARHEAEKAMHRILENPGSYQVAAFLAILKHRGETAEEVAGMLDALQKKSMRVSLTYPVLDIVGTGGDHANTVNISTGSAIVAAACGVPVAKHGNRSVSSQSGSADVLESLGINIEIAPEKIDQSLQAANIAFMYAPYYNASMKLLGPVRKGLKLATAFNMLGPLLNPAQAEYAVIGSATNEMMELMSKVVLELGYIKRAFVFFGCGVDELTPLGKAIGYEIKDGHRKRVELDPQAFGFKPCTLQDLRGGDAALNASLLTKVFAGEKSPIADALAFTAGVGLMVFNRTETIAEGIQIAQQALKEGRALQVLDKWKAIK